jgi:uncharacterized membrane protein
MPSDNITFTLSMEFDRFASFRVQVVSLMMQGFFLIAMTRLYDDDQEGYLVFSRLATIIGT